MAGEPWQTMAPANVAGFLAGLSLAILESESGDEAARMRRAARAVQRATSRPFTHYARRAFASRMGRYLDMALPDRALHIAVDGGGQIGPAGFCRNILIVAATAIISEMRVNSGVVEAAVHGALVAHDVAADDVADLALRWYIRDWVGSVPVPPTIRQAASAAWLADHPALAYQIVIDHVAGRSGG